MVRPGKLRTPNREESYWAARVLLPLGVTGNTSDSGSEESWFEPRRGNSGDGSMDVPTRASVERTVWRGGRVA